MWSRDSPCLCSPGPGDSPGRPPRLSRLGLHLSGPHASPSAALPFPSLRLLPVALSSIFPISLLLYFEPGLWPGDASPLTFPLRLLLSSLPARFPAPPRPCSGPPGTAASASTASEEVCPLTSLQKAYKACGSAGAAGSPGEQGGQEAAAVRSSSARESRARGERRRGRRMRGAAKPALPWPPQPAGWGA